MMVFSTRRSPASNAAPWSCDTTLESPARSQYAIILKATCVTRRICFKRAHARNSPVRSIKVLSSDFANVNTTSVICRRMSLWNSINYDVFSLGAMVMTCRRQFGRSNGGAHTMNKLSWACFNWHFHQQPIVTSAPSSKRRASIQFIKSWKASAKRISFGK